MKDELNRWDSWRNMLKFTSKVGKNFTRLRWEKREEKKEVSERRNMITEGTEGGCESGISMRE